MAEDPQSVWLDRYQSTQAQEKSLKELLHQKGASGVTNARDRLREEYERLILTDIVRAQAMEIESALWKNVFYIVIDGYRRKLATLERPEVNITDRRDDRRDGRGSGGRQHGNRGNKKPVPSVELRKVSTKFRAFIQEATGFYHRLIQNLASCYDLNEMGANMQSFPLAGKNPTLEITEAARQGAISSCHKCYIFLGDLARYRQTYNDSPKKNWSAARDYYNEARNLLPSSGNPYNQLAVIATFAPNNFLALYFYYRSLAVRLPFMTARNNIKVLIQKMTADPEKGRKFVREERHNDRNSVNSSVNNANNNNGKESSLLNDFLAKFILLHGSLFMRQVEGFDDKLMCEPLEGLFLDRQIDPELLLKIQIVNMSSLYTMCYIPLQDDGPSVTPQDQLTAERHALKLILATFATILHYCVPDLEQHRNGDNKSRSRPADFLPSNAHRSMPAIRLSLKWIQVNLHHVKRLTDGLSRQEKMTFKLDQIWDSLATFLNLLADVHPYTEDTIFCRDVLKEDTELQGFAALKRSIDERPLSIISPSKISPKAEMQMRIADMFQDALSIGRVEWVDFFGKSFENGVDGNRILQFDTEPFSEDEDEEEAKNEEVSAETTVRAFEGESQEESEEAEEEETDYEREAADEDLNPFHYAKTTLQSTPAQSSARKQRQAVDASVSDEDNDLSLIVGRDDDDEEEEEDGEEEVVLFTGRKNIVGGKPTPRPAHLKTTGVIGGGRRASMSPTNSNHSSPGLNENDGPASDGFLGFLGRGSAGGGGSGGIGGGARMNSSPSVDSVFGGFQFGVPDDWRQSISSIRTSRTMEAISPSENTWGGLSGHSLGNGLISPTSYEPRDGSVLNGFGSIPSRGPPGIPFQVNSPLNADPAGFFADSSFSHPKSRRPMYAPHARPRYQYQSSPTPVQEQQQQQQQHEYLLRSRAGTAQHQVIQDRDWR
ncbi:hypothetical protein BGZ83_008152 [Gryganskiella cystojenkinii]|nr:hypothetical protein BGZ83_008152 [Gryganskiella cystojenkinii]